MNLQWTQGYQKEDGCIHIITAKDTKYYYTKCIENNILFNTPICLLIKQTKGGSKFIMKIEVKNIKYTIDDRKVFQNVFGGNEINIIKNLDVQKNTIMVISFIDSFKQSPWKISFQTKYIMEKWYYLIIKNKSDYQRMLNEKPAFHSTNKKQICQNIQASKNLKMQQLYLDTKYQKYCDSPEVNQVLSDLVTRYFQPTFVNLVFQTDLDLMTKQIFIKQKLNSFNEQVRSIGRIINNKLQSTCQQFDRQKQSICKQIQFLKAQNKRYEEESNLLKEQVNKLTLSIQKSMQNLKIRDNKIEQIYKQLQQANKQANQLLSKFQQQSQCIENITYQNKSKQTQLQTFRTEIDRMKQQLLKSYQQKQQLQLQNLFCGDILNLQSPHKQYLKQIVQQLQNHRIVSSKLLFRFDELNKANFHRYIDNHPHLLIVIHLCNGIHLAAYISDPIYPKMLQISEKSCIISLTKMETFYLDPNKKIFRYDEYFINFGNSELQIKSQQNKLFSNFGIQNSCYQHRGRDINFLLNKDKNKECQMSEYEIFEIFFSGDKEITEKK